MSDIMLLFFAGVKERIGSSKIEYHTESNITVEELRQNLAHDYPQAADAMTHAIVAVNREFAADSDKIPDGAEVAIFPPVSGGSDGPDYIQISPEPIEVESILSHITFPTTGGICTFSGVVRGITERENRRTDTLEYDAYVPMAEAKMRQIAEEIHRRWPAVEAVALVQRIRMMLPGDHAVLVACSASHRDTGIFEAAHFGIDRLKEITPVWKKEIGPGGEEWVEGEYHPAKGE